MSAELKKGIVAILCVVILIFFYHQMTIGECKRRVTYRFANLNEGINLDSLFRPITAAEEQRVLLDWKNFELKSDSFQIVQQYNYSVDRAAKIVEHYAEGQKHYGAIILPFQYDSTREYPLLLWANGLDQRNPSVNFHTSFFFKKLARELDDYFLVVPSYRGQNLVVGDKCYCSDGFFGDAFDGATDDALRLMDLAQTQYQGIDTARLAVYGVSRGGTVALLAGSRYPQFNAVIAQSGPVDFLSPDVYNRYGLQFKYQFLSRTTDMTKIREKIIKSSPVHFIQQYPNPLVIIHGENDKVVPIENAVQLLEKLEGKENLEHTFLPAGHIIDHTAEVVNWLEKNN